MDEQTYKYYINKADLILETLFIYLLLFLLRKF